MVNVLVTGGCGRIGNKLVRHLLNGGDSVTVIDIKHCDIEGVKCITAPLSEIKELRNVDVVYHLAASIDYKASRDDLKKRNIEPTEQLLRLCKGCQQFVFMSTTSVYSESSEVIDESTPPKPYSDYGWSKLECEALVKASGIPYTILRSSQVYGPDFEEGYASFIKHLQNGDMRVFGDGNNYIPLIHINDLIGALLLVKQNKSAINQVFNVDGGYEKTQSQFFGIAARLLGVEPPAGRMHPRLARFLGALTGKGGRVTEYTDKLTMNRRISIDRISRVGFRPSVDLEAGMKEVIAAFRQRGMIK